MLTLVALLDESISPPLIILPTIPETKCSSFELYFS